MLNPGVPEPHGSHFETQSLPAIDEEREALGDALTRPPPRSLLAYSPLFVVVIILIADSRRIADPDLWGHIHFGQSMLSSWRVPRLDPYSYTAPGHQWLDHEYLSEVVAAFAYKHLGIIGLKLWKLGCTSAVVVFAVLAMGETGASVQIQLSALLLAAVAIVPQMQFRPQLHTFAMFAAMLAILARHNYRGKARLWILVPMMLLWVNLHGGFIVGCASLGFYTATIGLSDWIDGRGLQRFKTLVLISGACTLTTVMTPYGLGTWETVLHTLNNAATRKLIMDWQPLTLAIEHQWQFSRTGTVAYGCGLTVIIAAAIAFAFAPHGDDAPLVVIAAALTIAGFVAVRNFPLAVIACLTPLVRHVDLSLANCAPRSQRVLAHSAADQPRAARWILVGVAAAFACWTGLLTNRLRCDPAYPSGAVDFMRAHSLSGNILSEFHWGEYLIWHTGSKSKLFMDNRYDMVYPAEVINDHVAFSFALPGAAKVLRDYPNDFVLISPNAIAYDLVAAQSGRWKLIYRDADSALFARAELPAAHLAGVPITGTSPPLQYFP